MNFEIVQFKHPFTCMVAGPTSCGKTVLLRRILEFHRRMIKGLPEKCRILWAYGQWQEGYSKPIQGIGVEYNEGLPSEEEINASPPTIMIIDDLMTELGDNAKLANLFTKGSHHLKISIFFIVQNLFYKAKHIRNVSLNCHYLIIMKNPRDKSQIFALARQLRPNNCRFIIDSYEDATKKPYSYIKIDLTPQTPEEFRITADIIPDPYFNVTVYQECQRI